MPDPLHSDAREERFDISARLAEAHREVWRPDAAVLQEYRWSLEYLAAGSRGCLRSIRRVWCAFLGLGS